MKKNVIKIIIAVAVITTTIVYLNHRHQQALIDQQETPTDSDCCMDVCDSIPVDTIIHK